MFRIWKETKILARSGLSMSLVSRVTPRNLELGLEKGHIRFTRYDSEMDVLFGTCSTCINQTIDETSVIFVRPGDGHATVPSFPIPIRELHVGNRDPRTEVSVGGNVVVVVEGESWLIWNMESRHLIEVHDEDLREGECLLADSVSRDGYEVNILTRQLSLLKLRRVPGARLGSVKTGDGLMFESACLSIDGVFLIFSGVKASGDEGSVCISLMDVEVRTGGVISDVGSGSGAIESDGERPGGKKRKER